MIVNQIAREILDRVLALAQAKKGMDAMILYPHKE